MVWTDNHNQYDTPHHRSQDSYQTEKNIRTNKHAQLGSFNGLKG
jgi:hypothetical protein